MDGPLPLELRLGGATPLGCPMTCPLAVFEGGRDDVPCRMGNEGMAGAWNRDDGLYADDVGLKDDVGGGGGYEKGRGAGWEGSE